MILVCGEALVDLVPADGQRYQALAGGSPANVAVGVARLGSTVAWLGRSSRDHFGGWLREHLTAAGVDLSHVRLADAPSSLAVAFLDGEGRASYDFYVQGGADWGWLPGELPDPLPAAVTAIHCGSLLAALPPGCEELEALLRREARRGRVVVSFDPNLRAGLEPDLDACRRRVERQVASCHLVKASAEDLDLIYPGRGPAEVAVGWLRAGPAAVVITEGGAGATAFTRSATVRVPAPQVEVVDTVGAGDAFTSGLLAWLAEQGVLAAGPAALGTTDLRPALAFAVRVAALTCARQGADPPRREELAQA